MVSLTYFCSWRGLFSSALNDFKHSGIETLEAALLDGTACLLMISVLFSSIVEVLVNLISLL